MILICFILIKTSELKSLEKTVNTELNGLYDWLTANKLTLNIKKSNFVIFRPNQKKMLYQPKICIFDNETTQKANLECKNFIKYLGILIDSNLSWKQHIDYITLKISKTVGLIAKLRHFVPTDILLSIYRSLILPYLTYGLVIWGQTCKSYLKKILVLQKQVLRLIFFKNRREHANPLFVHSVIMPISLLYYQSVSNLMYDVNNGVAPIISSIHTHSTRSVASDNFYHEISRLKIQEKGFSRK